MSGATVQSPAVLARALASNGGARKVYRVLENIDSMEDLAGYTPADSAREISLAGFYPGALAGSDSKKLGYGQFNWFPNMPKANHNGGTIVSPSVPWSTNMSAWLSGVGETDFSGVGCWVRAYDGAEVYAEWFGAKPDYSYASKSGSDNSPSIQSALDTELNVHMGAGTFGFSATVEMHPHQTFTGFGCPQRGAKGRACMTELVAMADVDGISTEQNNASGARIEKIVLRAGYQGQFVNGVSALSTKTGLKFGEESASGGSSQQIKCQAEDCLVYDFNYGVGIHGFGYETVCRNVLASGFITYGFRVTDQSNIVSLYDCGALNSQPKLGAAKGFSISEAYQVGIYTPRMENNRVGMEVVDGGSCNVYNAYCEGNRVIDFIINDPKSSLTINGLIVFHQNEGVTTAAIFQVNAAASSSTSLVAKDMRVFVTKGFSGQNNTLTTFCLNNGNIGTLILENIDWQCNGTPHSGSGKAPDLMTFRQLSHLKLIGKGYLANNESIAVVNSVEAGPPVDAVFRLTDYDGATRLVGKNNGARVYRMDSTSADFYYYDGTSWQVSSK